MNLGYFTIGLVLALNVHAETLEDTEALQKKSLEASIKSLELFTQDRDVHGIPVKPGGPKQRSNQDDKNDFQTRFTMHNFMADTDDAAFNKALDEKIKSGQKLDPDKDKPRELPAGSSPHGATSDASQLELKDYSLDNEFGVPRSENEKKQDAEKGIERKGYQIRQKINIRKEEDGGKGGGSSTAATKPDPNESKEKVITIYRDTMEGKAKDEFEKIGDEGGKGLIRAARGPEAADDEKTLGSIRSFYNGAKRAFRAIWNNNIANLGQRRIVKNFAKDLNSEKMAQDELVSEDIPTCERLSEIKRQKLAQRAQQEKLKPEDVEKEQKRLQEEQQQCSTLASTTWKDINPRYERPDKNSDEKQLQMKGPNEEDGKERDIRVDLNMQAKVGIKATQIPSEWSYTDKDQKTKIAVGVDSNNEPITQELRMDEQIELFNEDVRETAKAIPEVKNRFPELRLKEKDVLENEIPIGELSAEQILERADRSVYEGYEGSMFPEKSGSAAASYDELQKQP